MCAAILVTGASGFIGKYVVRKLTELGHEVTALKYEQERIFADSAIREVRANLGSRLFLDESKENLGPVDAVIHLAADTRIPGNYDSFLNNLNCSWNALKLAERAHAHKLLYLSSIPIIGKPCSIPISEDHQAKPDTMYHMSKYFSEMLFSNCLKEGIKLDILRIASPLGVGMHQTTFVYNTLKKCKRNDTIELYGQGTRIQNYIDVRDVVRAILLALEPDVDGLFLLPGAGSLSNRELAEKCVRITGSKSEIVFSSCDDSEEGYRWIIDGSRAATILGYKPEIKFEDTLTWIYNSI